MNAVVKALLFAGATALTVAVLIPGCATNPATGRGEVVLMTEETELEIGRRVHQQILASQSLIEDQEIADYVQRIGTEVAESSDRANLIYRFHVLDSPQVNAFALPGGYIYIFRGLMAYMNSEAELAAVLGHEVAHVTARHAVRQHRNATLAQLLVAIVATQSGVQYGGDLANILGAAFVAGYGRTLELEADELGARYLASAGYNHRAMLDVIGVLKTQADFADERAKAKGEEPVTYHGVFASHPSADERLQEVVEAARSLGSGGDAKVNRDEYLERIEGMVFGFSEEEGIPRDNVFYHAPLGFAFGWPEGWRIENKPNTVELFAPQGETKITLVVTDLNKKQTPAQFVKERMNIREVKNARNYEINGKPAITGRVKPAMITTRLDRLAVIFHDNRAYVFRGQSKEAKEPAWFADKFTATVESFHDITPEEREAGRPYRIRLITADENTTYAKLAEESPLSEDAENYLRLMNAQYPIGEPEPGQRVKIVK